MSENVAELETPAVKGHLLTNNMYDIIKWLAQIGLPALGSLYFGLAQIWGLPNAEQVVGSIVVIDAFLGALLSLSTRSYDNSDAKYDGSMDVALLEDGTKRFLLNLNGDPSKLDTQSKVVFKVNSN